MSGGGWEHRHADGTTFVHPPGGTCDNKGWPDPKQEVLNAIQNDLIDQATGIAEWWAKTAMNDAERTVPKAVEYGSADMDFMGQFMVALVKDKFVGADDAELLRVGREMATTFYLVGKIGRMIGAFQQGMLPSDDTLFDTSVYAMMLRRIRETGDWIK